MKYLVLLLTVILISGCEKPQITELDRKLLLTDSDFVAIGCKPVDASKLVYESKGLEYLSKEVSVKYNESGGCGVYLYIEVTEFKIPIINGINVSTTLGAAIVGLKFADIETRVPDNVPDGLKGRYLELYGEDSDYQGFIYASQDGARSIVVMALRLDRKQQPMLLDLVKMVESRNYDREKVKTQKIYSAK